MAPRDAHPYLTRGSTARSALAGVTQAGEQRVGAGERFEHALQPLRRRIQHTVPDGLDVRHRNRKLVANVVDQRSHPGSTIL